MVGDGRFELIERLGAGGMGTVWRARDVTLGREVALKEVRAPDALPADEVDRIRQRALREARALARLAHPNVVTVHQVIEDESYPWIVMELVPGGSLQDALDRGGLSPDRAARAGLAVLGALRAAHEAGVLHRDVKPANVLLGPGDRVVLTDFGIAAVEGTPALTVTGSIIGSPEYLAPERVLGHTPRPEADLWSLGMLLYVAVEGYSPFRRASTMATLGAVLHEPLPPPRRAGALAPIIVELLAKDPDARPTGAESVARLEAAIRGDDAATLPTTAPPRPPMPPPGPESPPRRRLPLLAALLVVVLIAAGVLTALALTGDDGTPRAHASSPAPSAPPDTGPPAGSAAPTPPPSPPTTPGTTVPATTVTVTAPAPPPPAATASPTGRPGGRWIAQLASVPKSDEVTGRDAKLAEVRRQVPDAQVLDSDRYASLKPNYWVVYADGPFPDGTAVLAYCAARGRPVADLCVGRFLSGASADLKYVCAPANGTTTGICRRD